MHRGMIVCAGVILILIGSQGLAQVNRRSDRGGNPPPVDRGASAKARQDLADAEVTLNKAREQFANIRGPLRKDFEASTEWKVAQEMLKQAQADFDTSRARVIDQLKSKPDYQAAVQRKAKAEAERDALKDEPAGSPKQVEAATAVLNAGQQVTEMETAAMNADPRASEARKGLTQSADAVSQLNKRFEDTLEKEPKYKSAEKAVTEGEKKLAQAKAALASALNKEAAAERERQRRIDEADRRRAQDQRRRWRLR